MEPPEEGLYGDEGEYEVLGEELYDGLEEGLLDPPEDEGLLDPPEDEDEEPKLDVGEPWVGVPGGDTTDLAGDEGFLRGVPTKAASPCPAEAAVSEMLLQRTSHEVVLMVTQMET